MASGRKPRGSRAGRNNAVRTHHDQRKRAFHAAQRIGDRFRQSVFARQRDQVNDDFGVAVWSGKSNLAVSSRPRTSIAFTRLPLCATAIEPLFDCNQNRLRIQQRGIARGRGSEVCPMANVPRIFESTSSVKIVSDQAHALCTREVSPSDCNDGPPTPAHDAATHEARGTRASPLRDERRFANYTAFVVKFVGSQHLMISLLAPKYEVLFTRYHRWRTYSYVTKLRIRPQRCFPGPPS